MRSLQVALKISKENTTELVEFISKNRKGYNIGTLLNRRIVGLRTWYFDSGVVRCKCFYKNDLVHGEFLEFSESSKIEQHSFYSKGEILTDLDTLANSERDDAFYTTLALCEIYKEHTFNNYLQPGA